MTRAIWAGHTRAVQHERHRQLVERHIHEDLVERPVEECRVHRDHRMHAAHRQARRRSHRMLFGHADVDDSIREVLGEPVQPHRKFHRRGDPHDVWPVAGDDRDLLCEHRRPPRGGGCAALAGSRVGHADPVHPVGRVLFGGWVSLALDRYAVHEHRVRALPGEREYGIERGEVVPVDRPQVLEAEVLEQVRVARGAFPQCRKVRGD
jgi:hypothetical protein